MSRGIVVSGPQAAFPTRISAAGPPLDEIVVQAEEIQHATHRVIDDLVDRLGTVIQRGHGGHHDGPDLDRLNEKPCMSEMEWCFARKQHEAAAFLEGHVCGPKQEVVGVRVGDTRERLHGTRHHDHPHRSERTGRKRGSNVSHIMDPVGERLDVCEREVGFQFDGAVRSTADDEMRLDVVPIAKDLEKPDPVDDVARARKRDDDNYRYVAAWEFKGEGVEPNLHKEDLEFTEVQLVQRSYK